MLFSKFISTKYRLCIKSLSIILMGSFVLTVSSCETVSVHNYTPEKYEKLEEPSEQTVIELATNETTLNTSSCEVEYFKGKAEIPSKFNFEKIDTIPAKDISSKAFRLHKNKYEIILTDLKNIRTRDIDFNIGETLMWTGIATGIILVIGTIMYIISPPKMDFRGIFLR